MSSIATLNGVQYTIPGYNDTGWGANTGNVLTQYLAAIASATLQPTGGSFTLTADVDFGANFGIKCLFIKTETANPSATGVIRLASADTIGWRNNANGADISLSKDTSDNLKFNATKVLLSGAVVNADINASAAIAYSKLALTGAILNADLAGSIAYSKLVLTGSIVNGDLTAGTLLNTAINASAAIALSKLAALGTAKAVQTNAATGFLEASAVTNTELGYVSGVTSAIQTQLNATIANPLTADLACGSHKLTGLAAGTAAGNSVRYEQLVYITAPVQTRSTTTFTTTSNVFQTTNLSASITPSSSTRRIKITVHGVAQIGAVAGINTLVTLFRGSTNLATGGNADFQRVRAATAAITVGNIGITYIDSPASTSALTYAVKIANDDNTTTATFGSTDDQIMILEEIV